MNLCWIVAISAATMLTSGLGLGGGEPGASPSLPAGFMLEKEPAGAKTVEELKGQAKVGDAVVVRGRIGGSMNPFIEKRAVFTLMGAALKACSDDPNDKCKTPWDYCCDTPEAIAKHSATIQVVDAGGAPLRMGLKGVNGLKELSEVVVLGTVKEAKEKVLIINATGLFVVPSKPATGKAEGK